MTNLKRRASLPSGQRANDPGACYCGSTYGDHILKFCFENAKGKRSGITSPFHLHHAWRVEIYTYRNSRCCPRGPRRRNLWVLRKRQLCVIHLVFNTESMKPGNKLIGILKLSSYSHDWIWQLRRSCFPRVESVEVKIDETGLTGSAGGGTDCSSCRYLGERRRRMGRCDPLC